MTGVATGLVSGAASIVDAQNATQGASVDAQGALLTRTSTTDPSPVQLSDGTVTTQKAAVSPLGALSVSPDLRVPALLRMLLVEARVANELAAAALVAPTVSLTLLRADAERAVSEELSPQGP